MTRQQQTGFRHPRGARSVFTALATAAALALFGGYAGAEHAGGLELPTADSSLVAYEPAKGIEGRLTITGSDTMAPLMDRLANEFTRLHGYPKVNLFVEHPGTNPAMRQFLLKYSNQRRGDKARTGHTGAGFPEVLASSRAMSPEERAIFKSQNGHEVFEIPIAMDAVALYVSQQNPLQRLTMVQADAIFGTARKQGATADVNTWAAAGVAEWSSQSIHLYGRTRTSATHDFFAQNVLKGGTFKSQIQEVPGTAMEMLAVARDPQGIGYAGIGYENSFVRMVPLAQTAESPAVAPTAESVTNGTYPLSRTLYLYINEDPTKVIADPLLREFLKFVNTREGQQVVADAKFYLLPKERIMQNLMLIQGPTTTASLMDTRQQAVTVLVE